MKLFTATPSPFARKVSVALLEKGIPFETVIDLPWNADSQAPNLNPLGKIPILLLDDGRVIHDSKVIIEYLETLDHPPRLVPPEPRRRIAHKLLEATADGVCDAVVLIVLERSRASRLQSTDWITRQLHKVEGGVRALAEELGANEWFVPEEFGLADVAVGCMLGYLDLRLPEVDWRSRHANLVSFADRIFARESFAATLPRAQTITPLG